MNPLFENTTNLDDSIIDHIVEISLKRSSKHTRYRYMLLLIGFVSAGLAIVYGYNGIRILHTTTIITCIALLFVSGYSFLNFFTYNIKKEIADYREKNEQSLKMTRTFHIYKNTIRQQAGKNVAEYGPEHVADIESFSHYFLLKYENGYLIVDKDGFTKGTAEEFEAYIRERMMVL